MPHLPDHATHDPELIAAYAAGDASGSALADAAELVADCADCAVLHRDLRAIAVALPGLPPAVRPRDFRLTPEQAASLAPSGWRGFLAAFASPRFRLAAPLGTGLAAIGLAGLLLGTPGTLLPTGGAGTTAAEAPSPAASAGEEKAADTAGPTTDTALAAGGAPAASEAAALAPQAVPVPSAAASGLPDRLFAGDASAGPSDGRNALTSNAAAPSEPVEHVDAPARVPAASAGTSQPASNTLVLVLAAASLIAGLALIALRIGARRLT